LLDVAGIVKHVNVIAVLFGNELRWFESQVTTEAYPVDGEGKEVAN